jgi:hypothetical protein
VSHRCVPDERTIPRAHAIIQKAIEQISQGHPFPRARLTGWDRTEARQAPPQYFKDKDDEDDDGGFIGFRS